MNPANPPDGTAPRTYGTRQEIPVALPGRAAGRIRWVMQHHERVVVAWSGGKDSTLLLELALDTARIEGRRTLDVLWLDNEAEYAATVDFADRTAAKPRVRFHRLQESIDVPQCDIPGAPLPFRTWTLQPPFREREQGKQAVSLNGHNYFNVPGDDSLTVFSHAASRILGGPVAILDALRTDEGAAQRRATSLPRPDNHRGLLWSWKEPGGNFRYAPMFEWDASQVWAMIASRGLDYNSAYDRMAQLGTPAERARVGTLYHHVMTRAGLLHLVDPWAYERLAAQLPRLRDMPRREHYDGRAAATDRREG